MKPYLDTFRKLIDDLPADEYGEQIEPSHAERYDQMTDEERIAFQREVLTGFRNIPQRYSDAALENWTAPTQSHRNILASIRRYITQANKSLSFETGLIIHGNYGSGKTHLAVAVARLISRPSRRALFVDMSDLAAELKREYDDAEGDDRFSGDIIAAMRSTPIVVIDDLGVERLTPDIATKFGQIVHSRYNKRGAIAIFTTNLVWPREWVERYGEGNAARIGETCAAYRLPDYDFRGAR